MLPVAMIPCTATTAERPYARWANSAIARRPQLSDPGLTQGRENPIASWHVEPACCRDTMTIPITVRLRQVSERLP